MAEISSILSICLSFITGALECIQYLYRSDVCKSLLDSQHKHIHM